MKKILLLLVGMFVAIAANAELYIVGGNVAGEHSSSLTNNGWNPGGAVSIGRIGDYYCFAAKGEFKLGTKQAPWQADDGNTFDKTSIRCATSDYTDKQGASGVKTANLQAGYQDAPNCSSPFNDNELTEGITYYRVNADLSVIEASKTTDFGPNGGDETVVLYLLGDKVAPNQAVKFYDRWETNNPLQVNLVNGYYYFRSTGKFKISKTKGNDWSAFDAGNLKVIKDNWNDKEGASEVKTQQITTGGGDSYGPYDDNTLTYFRINKDLTVMDASRKSLYDLTEEHSYTYHLHNYTTLDGTRVQLVKADSDENTLTGKIHYSAPLSVDQNYTVHRFDAVTGTFEEFGCDAFTYNPAGTTIDLVAGKRGIIMPKDLKGDVSFTITLENNTPAKMTVSGGEITAENPYSYLLYHSFTSPDGKTLNQQIPFTAHGWHYDVDYVFTGEETGHLFRIEPLKDGAPLTGTRYVPVKNSGDYDPSAATTTYALNDNGIVTDIFPSDKPIRGRVRFTLRVKDDGTPQDLVLRGGTTDNTVFDDGLYTFYYYAKKNDVPAELKAIAYRVDGQQATVELGDADKAMRNTGKCVTIDGEEYDVWVRSFTGDFDAIPHRVSFFSGDLEEPFLADVPFVNYGFYTMGTDHALKGLELDYPQGQKPVTFYMHFKEDWIKKSRGEESDWYNKSQGTQADATLDPRCYVYSGSNPSGEEAWDNGITMQRISAKAPNGNLTVTQKYQLWKAEIPADKMTGTEKVCFVFPGKDEGSYWLYCSETGNDATYIWATAEKNNAGKDPYAIESYLSYEEFSRLDAQGRPTAYLVGNGGIEGLNSWTDFNGKPVDAVDGYFFLPVTASAGNANFKISWISVADARENAGLVDDKNDARAWATFDLGIIGVDDLFNYEGLSEEETPNINDNDRKVYFTTKQTLRYMNYNQYDFVVNTSAFTNGVTGYIVIDPECRSITVIPYEPRPTVDVHSSQQSKLSYNLTDDWATVEQLHSHDNHLNGADLNGHIYMTDFNTAKGKVTLHTVAKEEITEDFSVKYFLVMNADTIFKYECKTADDIPSAIDFDFLPMGTTNTTFQALYTNNKTKQSFHSYRYPIEITGMPSYPQPKGKITSTLIVHDPKDLTYGILIGLEYEKEITAYQHNYYGDFDFGVTMKDGTYRPLSHEFLHPQHRLVKAYKNFSQYNLEEWEYKAPEQPYADVNNWASKLFKAESADKATGKTYLYLYNAAETKEDLSEIASIDGTVSAVYPFLFVPGLDESVIHITKDSTPAAAPGRRAESASKFASSNMDVPSELISKVFEVGNIVSGIENVEAEAETDVEAEYFTISGVRVMGELTPGIYICRKGNRVEKIAIK